MMEVDFPSRNPYLESDYIAGRMKKALEACDDYEKYMDSIVAIQKRLPDVKILVLAYENTVEEIGVDRFIAVSYTHLQTGQRSFHFPAELPSPLLPFQESQRAELQYSLPP